MKAVRKRVVSGSFQHRRSPYWSVLRDWSVLWECLDNGQRDDADQDEDEDEVTAFRDNIISVSRSICQVHPQIGVRVLRTCWRSWWWDAPASYREDTVRGTARRWLRWEGENLR